MAQNATEAVDRTDSIEQYASGISSDLLTGSEEFVGTGYNGDGTFWGDLDRGVSWTDNVPYWAEVEFTTDGGRYAYRATISIDFDAWKDKHNTEQAIKEAVVDVAGSGYMGKIRRDTSVNQQWSGRFKVSGPFSGKLDVDELREALPDSLVLKMADVDGRGEYGRLTISEQSPE